VGAPGGAAVKVAELVPRSVIARACALVPLSLALWWFVLKSASLAVLRVVAVLPVGMLLAPSGLDAIKVNPDNGEWTFNVAVHMEAKNPQTGQIQAIESVEFAAEPDNVAFFAAGWFSYLALAVSAVGFDRREWRRVLQGLAWQTLVNVLGLAAYAYINASGTLQNTAGPVPPAVWVLKYFYHLIYLVIPFASPFAVALALHPQWRMWFGFDGPAQTVSARPKRAKA
jgi:hypothetical protein